MPRRTLAGYCVIASRSAGSKFPTTSRSVLSPVGGPDRERTRWWTSGGRNTPLPPRFFANVLFVVASRSSCADRAPSNPQQKQSQRYTEPSPSQRTAQLLGLPIGSRQNPRRQKRDELIPSGMRTVSRSARRRSFSDNTCAASFSARSRSSIAFVVESTEVIQINQ